MKRNFQNELVSVIIVHVDDFLGVYRKDNDIAEVHNAFVWGALSFFKNQKPLMYEGKEVTLKLNNRGRYLPDHHPEGVRLSATTNKFCKPCAWNATATRLCCRPSSLGITLQTHEPVKPTCGVQAASLGIRGSCAVQNCALRRHRRVRCRKNGLANARFPLPIFCALDDVNVALGHWHLADLTYGSLA